jgi:hypothetical protein
MHHVEFLRFVMVDIQLHHDLDDPITIMNGRCIHDPRTFQVGIHINGPLARVHECHCTRSNQEERSSGSQKKLGHCCLLWGLGLLATEDHHDCKGEHEAKESYQAPHEGTTLVMSQRFGFSVR